MRNCQEKFEVKVPCAQADQRRQLGMAQQRGAAGFGAKATRVEAQASLTGTGGRAHEMGRRPGRVLGRDAL